MKRHTFWTLVVGGSITTLSVYAINQALVQRYLAVKKLKHAQGTIYFNLPTNMITTTLLTGLGLVTYAKYKDCDPKLAGRTTKFDQLVPILVMDTMGMIPGLAGLFISCVFSAALSTVSSGINALALVHLEDIVRPLHKLLTGTPMTERLAGVVAKLLAMFFGLLTVGLAFLTGLLGGTMLTITLSSFGMTGGPLLGLFILAIFFPFVNPPGAICGLLCSLTFSCWVAIGTIVSQTRPSILSLSKAACDVIPYVNSTYLTATSMALPVTPNFTVTLDNSTSDVASVHSASKLSLYRMSYMWYSGSSVLVAILVGVLVSLLTGGLKQQEVNPNLVINVWRKVKQLVSRDKQQYMVTDQHSKLESHSLPESVHPDR